MEFQQSKDIVDKIDGLMKLKDRDRFIRSLGDLSALLIESNYPFVTDIINKVRAANDGEIHVTLRVKEGRVNTIVMTEFTKFIYK